MKRFKWKHIPIVGFLFLGYGVLILIGAGLLSLPRASAEGAGHGFVDCLFTSVSATCVTGLVPFETGLSWSLFGQIVILCLIQIGGLGFMTVITLFFLAFGKRVGLHNQNILMKAQGSFSLGEMLPLIRRIVLVTFGTELAGACVLATQLVPLYGKKGYYYSIFTSISAFCNAGFDVFGQGSLTAFSGNKVILLTLCVIIMIGSFGFVALSDLFQSRFRWRKMSLHTKTVILANALLYLCGGLFYYLSEFSGLGTPGAFLAMPLGDKIVNSLFLAVSPRTAGFAALDLTEMSASGNFLTIILMAIGGNSCSTAGGMKVTTIVVLWANLKASAKSSGEVSLLNRRISADVVKQAGSILLAYLVLILTSVLILGAVEPADLGVILFEVVSAIATVGLTLNLTGTLCVFSKIVILLLMYVGRLGALSFFDLIIRDTPAGGLTKTEGKIMVG